MTAGRKRSTSCSPRATRASAITSTRKMPSVLTNYLNDAFGADAKLPKSPAALPGYKATLRPVSDDGLKIVYVEYDMPGPNRMPFSAAPDKDGKLWIPDMGSANTLGWLDPKTGVVQEFTAPNSFRRRHSFGRARAGWLRVDFRAGREQSRPLGSENEAHHGISGHLQAGNGRARGRRFETHRARRFERDECGERPCSTI